MRVIIIVTGLEPNGAELMLLRLTNEFVRVHSLRVTVVCLAGRTSLGQRFEALVDEVIYANLDAGLSNAITGIVSLIRFLRTEKPDIVQTWMYHADLIGGILSFIFTKSILVWGIRNGSLDDTAPKRIKLLVKLNAWLSHILPQSIISCSRFAMNWHSRCGYCRKKLFFIPNGYSSKKGLLSPAEIRRKKISLGIPQENIVVGSFARYHPQKNLHGFLDIMKEVHKKVMNVTILMVGDQVDDTNVELLQIVRALNLVPCTILLGYRGDVHELNSVCNVVVSCSTYGEAFQNALAEALLAGVPCVSSDVGDARELLANYGKVIPISNRSELVEHILAYAGMVGQLRNQFSINSHRYILENYSIQRVAELYVEHYQNLLSARLNSH